MLDIVKVEHIGIRVSDKTASPAFYEDLGFKLLNDAGFEKGHPIIMEHPSGVVLNLLGPGTAGAGENILMDVGDKYPGITHVALRVASLEAAESVLAARGIAITGRMSFKDMRAIFIRDPDRTVIELDAYPGEAPQARENDDDTSDLDGYTDHP